MSVYVTTNGKTALLAAAVANLPSPLPQSKFFYIFEYGYQIYAKVDVVRQEGSLYLVASFDGDRARVQGYYNPSTKHLMVSRDEPHWTIQRRAADWLNTQMIRLPQGVMVGGVR